MSGPAGESGEKPLPGSEVSPTFGEYSSPPCFMHELDPSYLGLSEPEQQRASQAPQPQASDWPAVRLWRKETRARLIQQRVSISSQQRTEWSEEISRCLRAVLADSQAGLIGFYWPFRGEYDARPLLKSLHASGRRLALPVVVAKAQPLEFREWSPGVAMTRGVWDIPIPAEGDPVAPEVLLAPLVGFDPSGYRLGYGGGFYDRTIAAMPAKPLCIGVGFELSRLSTIHPQRHDIAMDTIITEARHLRSGSLHLKEGLGLSSGSVSWTAVDHR